MDPADQSALERERSRPIGDYFHRMPPLEDPREIKAGPNVSVLGNVVSARSTGGSAEASTDSEILFNDIDNNGAAQNYYLRGRIA